MATYDGVFDALGLREWCDAGASDGPMSMAALLAKAKGGDVVTPWYDIPFPSLDNLNKSCDAIARTRDMTAGVEQLCLDLKDALKFVLDPITQPLSWLLDGSLSLFGALPWWVLIPAILVLVVYASRSVGVTLFVAISFLFLAFIDHYSVSYTHLTLPTSG